MGKSTRKPGAERREEIFQAVFRIVGERGVTSLTTTALAEEIGVSTGALFRHFRSRDAILQEAVEYALVRIEETFPPAHLPPVERMLRLARNRVHLFESDPGLGWLVRSEQAYLTLPAGAVKRLRALVERSTDYIREAIRDGVAQGSIRSDIEPEALLIVVMGTVHALVGGSGMHRRSVRQRSRNRDRVLAALARLLSPDGARETDGSNGRRGPQLKPEV
ncbi:MAG: TetR/AcrR family transcriptional regulator [Candidatus Latescibacterota bacterium]|jgi:AcrR family transcriptional regulator